MFIYTNMLTRKIFELGYKRIGFVIERFADINEDGKLVGGYLHAQIENSENLIPPLYWNTHSNKIYDINKYIKKYRLDALISYSTLVSQSLEKSAEKIAKVAIFHADNCAFKNDKLKGICNRTQVGAEGVKILSEILRGNLPTKNGKSAQVHSITPRWA